MKRILIMAGLTLTALTASAQDTYENARLLGSDLNGTARYVGMGGALDALGADISTISTNPAGIGIFRHSTVSASLGVVSQEDARKFDHLSKTNLSVDQLGAVYSTRTGYNSFLNFAFNIHKSRNFDQILSAANSLNHASLNKLAYGKSVKGSEERGGYYLEENRNGAVEGWRNATSPDRAYTYTQWDHVYTNGLMWDKVNLPAGEAFKNNFLEATEYGFDRAHSGMIYDFDFNISGNIDNRVFLGLTLGLHTVDYKGYSEYQEFLVDSRDNPIGNTVLADEREITGNGFDIKAGAIFRPFEDSPFRIGVAISTPTWYDLKSKNATLLINATDYEQLHPDVKNWGYDEFSSGETYEFKYYTPWKFGLSLGHTFGNYLALGAGYEYADYSTSDNRINDGYDEYGEPDSYSDNVMNRHTENTLKGVSTWRVGAELKPDASLAVRFGYNYLSSMYSKNGFRDTNLASIGNWYSSTADYTNWESTQRLTCGMGYKHNGWSFDVAYQYNITKGTFYPFQLSEFQDIIANGNGDLVNETNYTTPTKVDFKRHQLLFTVGYTF